MIVHHSAAECTVLYSGAAHAINGAQAGVPVLHDVFPRAESCGDILCEVLPSGTIVMTNFLSARAPKDFLVSQIVQEAGRQNVPLSEVERKMF